MRFTRRLRECRASFALAAASCFAAGASGSGCSGNGEAISDAVDASDAPFEAPPPENDAGLDAAQPRDAEPFDAAPRVVVCTSSPCAKSLVTTLGQAANDRSEGFCALLDDGTVACWGANGVGQLGRGEDSALVDSPKPARVVGLSNVVQLDHTCAVDEDGAVWCWGGGPHLRNDAGAATVDSVPVRLPLPTAKRVAVGYTVGCAVIDDGMLCWGSNAAKQVESSSSSGALPPRPVALPAGTPIQNVSIGAATFAVRQDGEVLSWGANPPVGRVSSIKADPYPLPMVLRGVSSIDVADGNACATVAGTGYCWGRVDNAMTPLLRALPEPVVAPEPLVQIATTRFLKLGTLVQPSRWCGVGVSGAVYCWGLNANGQAGDATQDHAFHAVQVIGLGEPAVEVRAAQMSTCALLTSGKVYCWGNNFYGQLGNGRWKGVSLAPEEVLLP